MKQQTQKLTRKEVRQQLFDGLMLQIEPDLAMQNVEETSRKLAKMSEEERAETLKGYEEAYKQFRKLWPEYIQSAMQKLDGLYQEMQGVVSGKEADHMQGISDEIDSLI